MLNNPKLASTELTKFTPLQLEAWRKALKEMPTRSGGRRGGLHSESTLNRDMTCFRAALNLAFLDGLVTSDFAWRSKQRPIKKFIEKAPPASPRSSAAYASCRCGLAR